MDSGTLDIALSDHLICYSIFSWKSCVSKCPSPNYHRSLKTIDSTALLNDLQCAPWSIMDMFDEPSDKNEVFNSLYNGILDQHGPLKKSQPRKHRAPWAVHELQKMMVRSISQYIKQRPFQSYPHPRHVTDTCEGRVS